MNAELETKQLAPATHALGYGFGMSDQWNNKINDNKLLSRLTFGTARLLSILESEQNSTLATLGPEGTSSAEAARAFSACVSGARHCELFATYEDAASTVIQGGCDYLIVANAYPEINRFYLSHQLIVVGAFPFETPPYGIAVATNQAMKSPDFDIVAHPATEHLVASWFRYADSVPYYKGVSSTSEAAIAVSKGTASACITTDIARKLHHLAFVTRTIRIQMLWSVFTRRDHPAAGYLFGAENE